MTRRPHPVQSAVDKARALGWAWRLHGRIRLAQSILSHRRWCDQCRPHAEQAHAVLDGTYSKSLTRQMED